ncbi:MAG: hypothetical protein ACI837_000870 [Crocinitomicaceae bacterium]|jgi:hypothetical protein
MLDVDSINFTVTTEGYYYHFIAEYQDIPNDGPTAGVPLSGIVEINTASPIDVWHPANVAIAEIPVSIYIFDDSLTSLYDFPCDSMYQNFVDSIGHVYGTPVSLDETSENIASIYPNPFTNVVKIDFAEFGSHQIVLYNVEGQKVGSWNEVRVSMVIDTDHLSNGMYILDCSNMDRSQRYKIVKQ